jgi:hypothetical protein
MEGSILTLKTEFAHRIIKFFLHKEVIVAHEEAVTSNVSNPNPR